MKACLAVLCAVWAFLSGTSLGFAQSPTADPSESGPAVGAAPPPVTPLPTTTLPSPTLTNRAALRTNLPIRPRFTPPVPPAPGQGPAIPSPGATPALPGAPVRVSLPPGVTNMTAPAGANPAPTAALTPPVPGTPGIPASSPIPAAAVPTTAAPPAPGAAPGAIPGPSIAPPGATPGAGAAGAPMPTMSAVITPTTTNLVGLAGSAKIPEKVINLQVAPIEQVLSVYAELTGRTVLRPTALPATAITLRNQQELTKDEAIQALESVLSLNGITMINVGDKFVSAVPTQQALTEGAAFMKGDAKDLAETGQFVTKLITLTNALPTEVQQLLQTFGKVQGGIVAIDSTMTLVLRDYPANIKRMMELIDKIDVKVESEYKLEVIPIKYGKVEDIYSTMSSLIGGGAGGAVGGAGGVGGVGARRTSGGRGGGTGMGNSSSRGSSFRTNLRQNNLNQTGQQRYPGQVQPQAAQTGQMGGASTFNQRLQGIVNRMSGSGEAQLLGDAKIIPDERSNSLIVFATKEDMTMITNIVAKVDRLLAQVLIEAIIMDVELNDSLEFGVSAIMRPQKTGNLTSVAGMNNGQGFLSAITNIAAGSGLPGGFSYFGKYAGDMDIAVKALAANGRGEILATPRVQTSHATPANFTVGQSVPYVTSTYYGGYGYGGPSAQLQQLDVETFIDVTPYITPDGLVVMEINQNIEEITGYTEIANVGKMPNTTRRSATATVSVQDRDTIVLGGYIRASKSNAKSGVPILKDIPGLGALFRSTSKETKRTELLIFIRPTVLPSPRDAAAAATIEKERMPGIRDMEHDWKDEYEKMNQKSNKRNKK